MLWASSLAQNNEKAITYFWFILYLTYEAILIKHSLLNLYNFKFHLAPLLGEYYPRLQSFHHEKCEEKESNL